MARCKDFCHEVDPERQDPGATHAGRWPVSLRFDNWVTWNHWFCLGQECHTLKRACVWWIATLRPAITITTKNVRILGGIECPTFGQAPYTHTHFTTICIFFCWFGSLTQSHWICSSIVGKRSCWFLIRHLQMHTHTDCHIQTADVCKSVKKWFLFDWSKNKWNVYVYKASQSAFLLLFGGEPCIFCKGPMPRGGCR